MCTKCQHTSLKGWSCSESTADWCWCSLPVLFTHILGGKVQKQLRKTARRESALNSRYHASSVLFTACRKHTGNWTAELTWSSRHTHRQMRTDYCYQRLSLKNSNGKGGREEGVALTLKWVQIQDFFVACPFLTFSVAGFGEFVLLFYSVCFCVYVCFCFFTIFYWKQGCCF